VVLASITHAAKISSFMKRHGSLAVHVIRFADIRCIFIHRVLAARERNESRVGVRDVVDGIQS